MKAIASTTLLCLALAGCSSDDKGATQASEQGATEQGAAEAKGGGNEPAAPEGRAAAGKVPELGDDREIDVKFYLQPDGTGSKTENKRLELEDGELKVEAEVAEQFVVGKLPAEYREFQKRFFKSEPFK